MDRTETYVSENPIELMIYILKVTEFKEYIIFTLTFTIRKRKKEEEHF
jgi:hypothetical protein